jgi:hypothetical protein
MRKYALPVVTPVTAEAFSTDAVEATQRALEVLQEFNAALATNDAEALGSCFFAEQALWKDQLALTWHLRTFISPAKITSALLETKEQRSVTEKFEIRGQAQFALVGPTLVSWSCLSSGDRQISDYSENHSHSSPSRSASEPNHQPLRVQEEFGFCPSRFLSLRRGSKT